MAACAKSPHNALLQSTLWTSTGVGRWTLLGTAIDSLFQSEALPLYYQDDLGWAFRLLDPSDSVQGWVEYYVGPGKAIQTVAVSYESSSFSALAQRYQRLREYFRGVYGAAHGHPGEEVWETSNGLRVRLLLSPERRYLLLSFTRLRTSAFRQSAN